MRTLIKLTLLLRIGNIIIVTESSPIGPQRYSLSNVGGILRPYVEHHLLCVVLQPNNPADEVTSAYDCKNRRKQKNKQSSLGCT